MNSFIFAISVFLCTFFSYVSGFSVDETKELVIFACSIPLVNSIIQTLDRYEPTRVYQVSLLDREDFAEVIEEISKK